MYKAHVPGKCVRTYVRTYICPLTSSLRDRISFSKSESEAVWCCTCSFALREEFNMLKT